MRTHIMIIGYVVIKPECKQTRALSDLRQVTPPALRAPGRDPLKQRRRLIWSPVPASSESPLGLLHDLDPTCGRRRICFVGDSSSCQAFLFLAIQSCPTGSVVGWSRPPHIHPRGSSCSPAAPPALTCFQSSPPGSPRQRASQSGD